MGAEQDSRGAMGTGGGRRLAIVVGAFLAGAVAVLIAHGDSTTVGMQQWGIAVAILGAPTLGAFANAVLDRSRARFVQQALVPALSTYVGVLLGSLGVGGWALNWLVFAGLWCVGAATLGLLAGRLVHALRSPPA